MINPLVSVFMMTYNHEEYIGQAIEGILMQKVNFAYEIVIGEDCSSDRTREILLAYKNKYSDRFKLLLHGANIGASKNQIEVFNNCSGTYIALCEGDDYWTDPYKLQKQVNFLEANPDYGMVSGNVDLINEKGESLPDNQMVLKQQENRKPTVDFFDLLKTNLVNTLTVCVRANLMRELTERVVKEDLWFVYDHWFWLQIALKNKVRIFDDKMAAYRVHSAGASRQKDFFTTRKRKIRLDAIHSALEQEKYRSAILIKILIREHIKELKRRLVTLIKKVKE